MSDSNFKTMRKQIRNVIQEVSPQLVTDELVTNIYQKLSKEMGLRMDVIQNQAKEALEAIDNRQKEFQQLIIRQVMAPAQGVTDVVPSPDPAVETKAVDPLEG